MTVILGVDPGLRNCGLAVLRCGSAQNRELVMQSTITPKRSGPVDYRLATICKGVAEAAARASSNGSVMFYMAVEDQAGVQEGHRLRGTTNAPTLYLREVVGIARAYAWIYKGLFVSVSSAELRKALGLPAGAGKQRIQAMVQQVLKTTMETEHNADAAAAAIALHKRLLIPERLIQ